VACNLVKSFRFGFRCAWAILLTTIPERVCPNIRFNCCNIFIQEDYGDVEGCDTASPEAVGGKIRMVNFGIMCSSTSLVLRSGGSILLRPQKAESFSEEAWACSYTIHVCVNFAFVAEKTGTIFRDLRPDQWGGHCRSISLHF
jgi:hypothetical protein